MADVTNEFLSRLIHTRFEVMTRELSALQTRMDLVLASVRNLATTHASVGQVETVQEELNRLRRHMINMEARITALEQDAEYTPST